MNMHTMQNSLATNAGLAFCIYRWFLHLFVNTVMYLALCACTRCGTHSSTTAALWSTSTGEEFVFRYNVDRHVIIQLAWVITICIGPQCALPRTSMKHDVYHTRYHTGPRPTC